MNSGNFFTELKRRNVLRAAAFYAASAWLLVQVATQVFPFFHIAEGVVRAIVVAACIGFPFAMLFSWFYEWTPQGIQRESEVAPNESVTRQTGKKLDRWIIAILILAVVLLLTDKLVFRPNEKPSPDAAAFAVPEKSIAVLPFDNLSRDPENAYFSEGIQDEILTRLAKIAELKVISRTSTQRFKSSPEDLRQIAQQLGVAHILEGSVQKSGDHVRVNVQLIKAATDAHLWADTYDRKLTDVFAVESEIAKTVAETLQAKLTGSAAQVLASRPTENPEAHQLYLKGRYFWNKRNVENLKKAISYFQQAIDLDPNYALAYAGLGDAHALLPIYAGTAPKNDIPKALAAARKAVELDDSLAEAHTSLANALVSNVQLAASEPEFRRAIELNPNYATAHQWFGECLFGEGRYPEALSEIERAYDLDPLSPIINVDYGMGLAGVGRTSDAIDQLRKTIDLEPGLRPAHEMLGQMFEDTGKLDQAIAEYEKSRQLGATPSVLAMIAYA
ncbi:MAG: tetratricopeptide repeat protein, partial [Spartobacteria bacterium]